MSDKGRFLSSDLAALQTRISEKVVREANSTTISSSVASPAAPDVERDYAFLARPVALALAADPGAAMSALVQPVGAACPAAGRVDFDRVRGVLQEMERRGLVDIIHRDELKGDHRYRLTERGRVVAS